MTTAKQEVQKVLATLPDETSLEDIQYHLYVLQRIERGRLLSRQQREGTMAERRIDPIRALGAD